MDRSKYDRATLFLEYIKHIDDLSSFICSARERELGLLLRECGFISDPQTFTLTETDVAMMINALEKEKKELEDAFAAL